MEEWEVALYVILGGIAVVLGALRIRAKHINRRVCLKLGHYPLRDYLDDTECVICGKKLYRDYKNYGNWTTEKKE